MCGPLTVAILAPCHARPLSEPPPSSGGGKRRVCPRVAAESVPWHTGTLHGSAEAPWMTIVVGKLYWETTADAREQLFTPYGTRERVEMLVDHVTGRSRGFGFVARPNSTEAQAA